MREGAAVSMFARLVVALSLASLCAAGCRVESGGEDIRTRNAEEGDEPRLVNGDWRVVKMATAHGSLVIEVEASDPGDALRIARSLTAPLEETYDEVLVYVTQLGDASGLSMRRVQWTPAHGYVEGR